METKNTTFDTKWNETLRKDKTEEFTAFVPMGAKPHTQRQLFLYQYYSFIRKHFGAKSPEHTLEMGCGRGTVSLYFNLYDSAEISMVDLSAAAIDLAKKNIAFHGAEGTALVSGADATPFSDKSFDLVFSIGLLEHLDDYTGIVREKYRVLRPGGMVASLNIPQKNSIQVLNSMYRYILKMCGKKTNLKEDYYRNSHSPETYKDAFIKAGFSKVEIIPMTPFPLFTPLWPWAEYVLTYVYRFLLLLRSTWMKHPFQATRLCGQSHMIIAWK